MGSMRVSNKSFNGEREERERDEDGDRGEGWEREEIELDGETADEWGRQRGIR
jgi:hypothetical protein